MRELVEVEEEHGAVGRGQRADEGVEPVEARSGGRGVVDGEGGEVLRPVPAHGEEPDDPGPPSTLRPGEEPAGLDRLITAGAAIVCGEDAE